MKVTIEFESLGTAIAVLHQLEEWIADPNTPDVVVENPYARNAMEIAREDGEPDNDAPDLVTQAVEHIQPPKPRPGTAAALLNGSGEPRQSGGATVATIVANLQAEGRATTQYMQTADKVRLKVGDEVLDPDGVVGVIAATYRGIGVIEYEDNSAAQHKASDLMSVPQEDTHPPATQSQPAHPSPAEQNASQPKENGGGPLITAAKANVLRELANDICTKKLAAPAEVKALLDAYSANTFDDLPATAEAPMRASLEELAKVTESPTQTGYGF